MSVNCIWQKAAQVRDEGQAALVAAQNKERELNGKDESLNKQLKILRERERQIAEVSIVGK